MNFSAFLTLSPWCIGACWTPHPLFEGKCDVCDDFELADEVQ